MPTKTKSYHYHRPRLHGDLVLGISGLCAGLVFTFAALETRFLFFLFLVVTTLALYFSANSLRRYWIEIQTDDKGIKLLSRGSEKCLIKWSEVKSIKLRFFGSKSQREKGKGTLSLTMTDQNKAKIAFESGLVDFDELARLCFEQTQDSSVEMDAVSVGNFEAVGVRL